MLDADGLAAERGVQHLFHLNSVRRIGQEGLGGFFLLSSSYPTTYYFFGSRKHGTAVLDLRKYGNLEGEKSAAFKTALRRLVQLFSKLPIGTHIDGPETPGNTHLRTGGFGLGQRLSEATGISLHLLPVYSSPPEPSANTHGRQQGEPVLLYFVEHESTTEPILGTIDIDSLHFLHSGVLGAVHRSSEGFLRVNFNNAEG